MSLSFCARYVLAHGDDTSRLCAKPLKVVAKRKHYRQTADVENGGKIVIMSLILPEAIAENVL